MLVFGRLYVGIGPAEALRRVPVIDVLEPG